MYESQWASRRLHKYPLEDENQKMQCWNKPPSLLAVACQAARYSGWEKPHHSSISFDTGEMCVCTVWNTMWYFVRIRCLSPSTAWQHRSKVRWASRTCCKGAWSFSSENPIIAVRGEWKERMHTSHKSIVHCCGSHMLMGVIVRCRARVSSRRLLSF